MGFFRLPDKEGIGQTPIQNNLHDDTLKKGEFISGSEWLIDPYCVTNFKGHLNGFERKFHTEGGV